MNTPESVLQACIVEGNIVKLPNVQLDRKLYQDTAKKLQLIGGKWKGGKISGFIFDNDPTDLLAQIAGGEKRNLKKEFQFFATPDDLADRLVSLAGIRPTDTILEPSAGQGAIVKAIQRASSNHPVYGYELMDINRSFLSKLRLFVLAGDDFLLATPTHTYSKIIANPPFAKNQDIDHILHMFSFLAPGGRLVSIASKHWQHSSNKKETNFRRWLSDMDAEIIELDGGEFKSSGTSVAAVIIVIDKPQ